jgi:hypothetical protein
VSERLLSAHLTPDHTRRAGGSLKILQILLQDCSKRALEHFYRALDLDPNDHVAHFDIGLGDKERAFEWLEKAYNDREWYLWLLKQETGVDPIRSDPRFQDLLRRIGLAKT